ncbi:hypothetical protein J2W49_002810 [Hydrogenophaga palleronii]|uniref:Uncharacterized protein n=1 Tax=Hydrogenophaga palleronii TaxID=65655 RepID=A0ABU1WP79_9BURK|nr:hypothetical protein [Hydrogenophaga palleronii]MDR7150847.1 hypothetical protein [Hydrogenophaga palleronii]
MDAMQDKRFVRVHRRFESTPVRGYVMDVGPKFFLFCLVSDRQWFNGFECFRIADVKGLKHDPYADFSEAALKLRAERKPRKPKISLQGKEEMLLTAAQAFPLVTIHREKVDPDVCHIGKVVSVKAKRVRFLLIGPDAQWDENPTDFSFREITRVSFGGDYEDALHIVGGSPST